MVRRVQSGLSGSPALGSVPQAGDVSFSAADNAYETEGFWANTRGVSVRLCEKMCTTGCIGGGHRSNVDHGLVHSGGVEVDRSGGLVSSASAVDEAADVDLWLVGTG